MKRSVISAVVIAIVAGALVLALHLAGTLAGIELMVSGMLGGNSGAATKIMSPYVQYALVFAAAFFVAWIYLATAQRRKLAWLVPLFVVELLALGWICALFSTFFQPLPAVLSALFALGAAAGLDAFLHWRANRPVREPEPEAAPEPEPIIPAAPMLASVPAALEPERPLLVEAPVPVEPAPPSAPPVAPPPRRSVPAAAAGDSHVHDVTVVVCDIGNKYDLADELDPSDFGHVSADFIARATRAFTDAGAFVESAAGEGIVAVFGYPRGSETHAEIATRAAMRLVDTLAANSANGESPHDSQLQLHAGVSSGRIIVTPLKAGSGAQTLIVGEPVELARRFCIANRFYGSRVLIGPGTFELAGQILVARPIDFLSGVDVRERHEIYEPISLAENATDDAIRRRDSFWNGVVLYREKRWAEAYAHFQRARSPENDNDPPLNLYLRRLEPLALQLTNAPLDE